MKKLIDTHLLSLVLICSISIITYNLKAQSGPQPGDIYKEYSVNLKVGNNWRVTDPNAGNAGAQDFLPNPVLSINIDDLEGAVRAEALMDIWGGHTGTTDKQFRFNDSSWIDIPNITTTPAGSNPECWLAEYNAIVDLPLQHLVEGVNSFEGNSGPQLCFNFNWGQWGWYVMIVRVYYGTEKPHTTATLANPAHDDIINENPVLSVNSDQPENIAEVQYLGKYEGYDENGDGIYYDWHRAYHGTSISGHIGTTNSAPFNVTWNTDWIPDQEEGAISFRARVKDVNGVWFVTEDLDNISLQRTEGTSVKLFTPRNVPQRFWVRAGRKMGCLIDVDELTNAMNARIVHRTWNGGDDNAAGGTFSRPLLFNDQQFKCYGKNHFYALSNVSIPVADIKTGANDVSYRSSTEHHGIEILWPGPAIMIRYNSAAEKVADPVFNPPSEHTFKDPFTASISSATSGAAIYYSVDRYNPNQSGSKYSTPIPVNNDYTIKAMAFKEGMFESNLVTVTYTLDTTTTTVFNYPDINSGVNIYPNPSNDHIIIEMAENLKFDSVRLFNSSGRLVMDCIKTDYPINLRAFQPGVYYLGFTGMEIPLMKKIIIN